MHRPEPESVLARTIAVVISIMSILFCLQGIWTEYELFIVLFFGIDVFTGVYIVGIIASVALLIGIWRRNTTVELWGLMFATWLYAFIGLFTLTVSYLQSPFIVVCLMLAALNGALVAYVKERRIADEKNLSSVTTRRD